MSSQHPKLAIIAGGGNPPHHLISACQKLGREFFVICLEGQADSNLAQNLPHAWLHLGAFSKLKAIAEEQQLKEVVMIGRVRRPSLSEIKPDFAAIKVLAKIGLNALGDDALLRSIGKAIEDETGMRMIGAQDVFGDFLTPAGQLGRIAPDDEAQKAIVRGMEVARALGAFDIGQSVIVQQGLVLGVEAIEGTDALIARSIGLRREGPGSVLVKLAKPQQDNRYDLPTIGTDTIEAMQRAGLCGVALEAGRSLLVDREHCVALADTAGIFIYGLTVVNKTDA